MVCVIICLKFWDFGKVLVIIIERGMLIIKGDLNIFDF